MPLEGVRESEAFSAGFTLEFFSGMNAFLVGVGQIVVLQSAEVRKRFEASCTFIYSSFFSVN